MTNLSEDYRGGIFQKIVRDNAVVSLFDGSTVVNLNAVGLQLRSLAEGGSRTGSSDRARLRERLETVFFLEGALPEFNPDKLSLLNRGRDDVLQGLAASLEDLRRLRSKREVDSRVSGTIISLIGPLLEEIDGLGRRVRDLVKRQGLAFARSHELFELSKRYCIFHAATACVHMWLYNRTLLGDFFSEGEWLALCLSRLMTPFRLPRGPQFESYAENVARELLKYYQDDRLFSIAPFRLARTEAITGVDPHP